MSTVSDKPNFLIAGAPRCGSTTLFKLLSKSEEVFMPSNKEPHYFASDQVGVGPGHEGRETVRVESDYRSLFASELAQSAPLRGECSIGYLNFHCSSVARIKEYLGTDVKIILTLRHPVERAFSSYVLHRQVGNEPLSFEHAIKPEEVERRVSEGYWFGYRYLELSEYAQGLEHFMRVFPNVHVVVAEEYRQNPHNHFRAVCDFLEIESRFVEDLDLGEKHNAASVPYSSSLRRVSRALARRSSLLRPLMLRIDNINSFRPCLNEVTRCRLNEYFLPEVERVEALIGCELKSWKD